ncbi:hypothetical protein DIPPA_04114 [Diplonema papillatum]|nr:hypothetical protein DIPPA_04114 [Diplonema papillatum]
MAQDSWSLPDSDDGRPDEKDDAMSADGGGAGEDDDDCDEERYNTWRAHWKYLYSIQHRRVAARRRFEAAHDRIPLRGQHVRCSESA